MINNHIWRCQFHLIPPVGWLNDPNGLCQYQGTYHVFFQYAPEYPEHDVKSWGHYISTDLVHWTFMGIAFYPDTDYDKSGAYSGCALAEKDLLTIYYTGNVQQEGNHDYTHSGRESNTIRVTSRDGIHFSEKECVLRNPDYPSHYTCHIRDPKVWQADNLYKMVLGGRTREDVGSILLYQSEDGIHWSYLRELTSRQTFGYMWECPDIFQMVGQQFLSFCPQGLDSEEFRYQNPHQSGYVPLDRNMAEPIDETGFREWDMGFDFYAPQTFVDEAGRRILIGWVGGPDAVYDEPTLKHHWIHTLTIPRILTNRDGILLQSPIPELEALRSDCQEVAAGHWFRYDSCFDWELELTDTGKPDFSLFITKELELSYNGSVIALTFHNDLGAGRKVRKVCCPRVTNIRILADRSILEIFMNDGAIVQTTRFFPASTELDLCAEGSFTQNRIWSMNQRVVQIPSGQSELGINAN